MKTISDILLEGIGEDKSDKGYGLDHSDWFRIEGYNTAKEEIRARVGETEREIGKIVSENSMPIFMQHPVVFNGKYYIQIPEGTDVVTVCRDGRMYEFTLPENDITSGPDEGVRE